MALSGAKTRSGPGSNVSEGLIPYSHYWMQLTSIRKVHFLMRVMILPIKKLSFIVFLGGNLPLKVPIIIKSCWQHEIPWQRIMETFWLLLLFFFSHQQTPLLDTRLVDCYLFSCHRCDLLFFLASKHSCWSVNKNKEKCLSFHFKTLYKSNCSYLSKS